MDGWICLHRKMLDWEWYTESKTFLLFVHLLLSANHKDKKYRGDVIERGCLVTSYELLSAETGMSVQNIRTALKNLKSTGEVTQKSSRKGTLIQIVKWDEYQQPNSKLTAKLTNSQQTANKQLTTNNNDNNDNNETNNIMRGTRLHDVWEAPESFVSYCEDKYPTVDAKEALAQFKDYWISKPGKDGIKKDWFATWRNWLRNGYSLPQKKQKTEWFGTRKEWTGGV